MHIHDHREQFFFIIVTLRLPLSLGNIEAPKLISATKPGLKYNTPCFEEYTAVDLLGSIKPSLSAQGAGNF